MGGATEEGSKSTEWYLNGRTWMEKKKGEGK